MGHFNTLFEAHNFSFVSRVLILFGTQAVVYNMVFIWYSYFYIKDTIMYTLVEFATKRKIMQTKDTKKRFPPTKDLVTPGGAPLAKLTPTRQREHMHLWCCI